MKLKEVWKRTCKVVKTTNEAVDNFERRLTGRENGFDDILDEGVKKGWEASKKGYKWSKEAVQEAALDVKCRALAYKIKKHLDKLEKEEEKK